MCRLRIRQLNPLYAALAEVPACHIIGDRDPIKEVWGVCSPLPGAVASCLPEGCGALPAAGTAVNR